jgi:signal transduction histidine kinase
MRWMKFQSSPIRIKLLIIILGICTSALVLSSIILTVLNWTSERRLLIERMEMITDIVALHARPALEFMDPAAAQESLMALQANRHVRRACLYNEEGREFSNYVNPDFSHAPDQRCPPAQAQNMRMYWSNLSLYHDVMHNDRKVGSIFIERDLADLYERLMEIISYKLITIMIVICWVWGLTSYFQRVISQPVIRLAENAWLFSHNRKHEINVDYAGKDEIGTLIEAFRTMTGEISRNERQLEQAIDELTRSNNELERFAHICSHDLQEPLRMVSSYTALLKRENQDRLSAESQQYLDFILEGAERMRELIKDILAYARLGSQAEAVQRVDLNRLADYVLKNLAAAIEERKARIHIDPLPEVTGSKTLLLQIFQNLIGNAIKFTTTTPEVHVSVTRIDNGWQFAVSDNGIGIDPRYHDRIFEVFKRLNRREEFQGTGIGLAIVKKAVQYHGGRVWVESQLGKGTTFFFTIHEETTWNRT